MYKQSVSLEPDESRVVEFTWKTLRYDVGGHRLRVEAEAKYDVDMSNNYSESAWVEILTNRDITLGFGNDYPSHQVVNETSKPRVKSAPDVLPAVTVLNDAPSATAERGIEPSQETLRMSPLLCAQQQQRTPGWQPHQERCPGVWALVL